MSYLIKYACRVCVCFTFRFHGLSTLLYTAKHKDPDRLEKIITDLREIPFEVDGRWFLKNDAFRRLCKRGVGGLLERSGDLYRDNGHLWRFNELFSNGDKTLRRAIVPREPLAVICHGDFNRNNALFRYDDEGLPIDELLFDFGTSRYGSPAMDLSFFFYMNTTQKLRESRWDDLPTEYCSTLSETVPSAVRVPNRAELDSEIAACAIYGFAPFFLPYQFTSDNIHSELNEEETTEWMLHIGGDNGTELVADLVQHIVNMGYTDVWRGYRLGRLIIVRYRSPADHHNIVIHWILRLCICTMSNTFFYIVSYNINNNCVDISIMYYVYITLNYHWS